MSNAIMDECVIRRIWSRENAMCVREAKEEPVAASDIAAGEGLRNSVFACDVVDKSWLLFTKPLQIFSVSKLSAVVPTLRKIEQIVEQKKLYAAGFITYEAASAFDKSLATLPPSDCPLLWFGIYREPEKIKDYAFDSGEGSESLEWEATINAQEYGNALAKIKEYIASGDTYQVNYTYRLRTAFKGSAWRLFNALAGTQLADYSIYIETEDWAVCSASPEMFFIRDGDSVVSRPMKGTAARGMTLKQDRRQIQKLKTSIKDRAENIMITDMVRNDLGRIAEVGSVETKYICAAEKFPTVWQMTSSVSARCRCELTDIFKALYPPASITGAPKCETMRIIAEIESSQRDVYTGTAGFIKPGNQAQFNVAIRTALVDKRANTVEYGVGGGIVWDSETDSEFAETLTKARVLKENIPSFNLLETLLWKPDSGYYLLDRHLTRMADSAEYFSYPFDLAYIQKELQDLAGKLPAKSHKLRLLLDSAGKVRLQTEPIVALSANSIPKVALAKKPIDPGNPFLYHKTSNRRVYQEAAIAGYDDVILWNPQGEISESTIANVVVKIDGKNHTPPVQSGLLAGTLRAELLERGEIRERIIKVEELGQAEEICLLNSVRGVYRVSVFSPDSGFV